MRLTQLLATGLLVSGLASTAIASTITVTNTIPTFTTDNTETASLPFFESAPGFVAGDVLTGVQIEFDATETISSLTITNNAAGSETFIFTSDGTVSGAGTAPGASSIPAIALNTFGPTTFTIAGGGSTAPIPPPVSTAFDSGLVSESISPYDTTGTFTLGFTTLNGFSFVGGGNNLAASEATTASGTVEAIYTFAPAGPPPPHIPEPSSIVMVGSVLLFTGLLLRKRRSRA